MKELKLLFDNFETLADAPNGIKKIRETILQLAVQSKLVPQNPNDEPASALLQKIKTEKEKLIKEKKIKKQKPLQPITDEEIPFKIPESWEWVRLGEIGNIFNGNSVNSHKKDQYRLVKKGLDYIGTKDVGYGDLKLQYNNGVLIPFSEPKFKIAHKNAVLICSEGGSAGRKIGLTDRDIFFGNKLFANEVLFGISEKFIFYLYQSPYFFVQFKSFMTGIIGGVSLNNFLQLLIPLPPFAEQKRIVEKVDQLMALCYKLEAEKAKRDKRRISLNTASLSALTSSTTQPDFNANWKHITDNFNTLYSVPDNVKKLKGTILQLAVQGKLTESWRQDNPDIEPASVLLQKIKAEKEKLIKEKKIKKGKPLPPINKEEIPFVIPKNWELLQMGSTIELVSGQHLKSNEYNNTLSGIPYLTGPADFGEINPNPTRWTKVRKAIALNGDILITVKGSGIGKLNILAYSESAISRQLMSIRPILLNTAYIYLFLRTGYDSFQSLGVGIAIPGIGRNDVLNKLVPIPPLAEQKRIVEKVDQLMAFCDKLEEKMIKSQHHSEKLINSILNKI